MNPPRRLRGAFGMCNLREGFVNLREGFEVAPWRLREAFSKTRSAKASRRRHGRLHLETIRQIMTSPPKEGRNTPSGRKTYLVQFTLLLDKRGSGNDTEYSEKATLRKKQEKRGHRQLLGNCVWLPGPMHIEERFYYIETRLLNN